MGDLAIIYSYSPGAVEIYMKNVVKCLPILDSLTSFTYTVPYSIYQPDVAVVDNNTTSYTAYAIIVGLDASSTSLDVYKVSSIEIWNLFGQKLQSKAVSSHEEIIDFSLGELPQGAYYLKVIKSDNSTEVLKFVHN